MGARLALELCLSGELVPLAAVEDGNVAVNSFTQEWASADCSVTSVTVPILLMPLVKNTSPDHV